MPNRYSKIYNRLNNMTGYYKPDTFNSKSNAKHEGIRRKRLIILCLAILALVLILTYYQTRVLRFGTDIPISSTILMFSLINIDMLLLLILFNFTCIFKLSNKKNSL